VSLQPGKLPAAMLAELLSKITHRDPRVLVGPGIGRDAAVIDLGDRLLVAKTDPVTFAADRIGWYAVNVNANDVACMGARPAWFLATALLPAGAPDSLPGQIFDDLQAACEALSIELVGGHTEVTRGIDRPMIIGAMLGEAARDEIVLGDNVTLGDAVLLTKGIAVEGSALLARDAPGVLAARGVPADTITEAANMLFEPGISVVADARAICAAARPHAMHDPTEGGIATALYEMAQAAGAAIHITPGAIRVFDPTVAVCAALGLDPLGLLASGALLAIVAENDAAGAQRTLNERGIDCARIGHVVEGAAAVILGAENQAAPLPSFARDELARFFDEQQHPEGL
jgi:hydrogenase expression/formation protein HypE